MEDPSSTSFYYTISGDSSSSGFVAISTLIDGLECVSDKKYKFALSSQDHASQLHLHILHEPAHVDQIKLALETPGVDYMIVTYDSESSAINRKTGPRTAK